MSSSIKFRNARNVGTQGISKTRYYVKLSKFGLNIYYDMANIVIEPSNATTAKMEAEGKYMRLFWPAGRRLLFDHSTLLGN
jgi:hypothetical protein